jgi:tetratricopeptide (TPR) repeat protein
MNRVKAFALATLLVCAAPALAKDAPPAKPNPPAAAQPGEAIDEAAQYKHCVALARQKPEDGWEESLAWSSLGGGDPARHCGAIALFGLHQYEEAAKRLELLATESHASPKLRAGMLAQAGQAWLLAKLPEKAYAAQSAALALVPGAPDLLVDRAQSLAEAKNWKLAQADLDKALAAAPNRADALTFRATAKRYLDDLPGAAADSAAAIAIDPLYQDAWLEAGMVKRLQNNPNGARQDWLKVLEIAPNSPGADMARRNIEMMDLKDK